jgi:hypothetical protein
MAMHTELQNGPAAWRVSAAEDALMSGALDSPILPSQWNELSRSAAYLEGERRLMVAVLEAAIHDYLLNAARRTRTERLRFAEVSRWFAQRGARPDLFSFEWLCQALRIDAGRLRSRLDEIRRRGTAPRRYAVGCASGRYRSVRRITPGQSSSQPRISAGTA